MIRRIEVVSTPRLSSKGTTNRDTYGEGENIRIEVRFDQPVVVEGEPTFALEVGNPCLAVCEAYYESGSGTNTLVFAYLVLEVDIDRNGIAIRGNPIEVVSGDSIRNAADQEAHLSSKGKGTQRGHKVDGSRAAGSHLSVEDAEAHEADGEMEFTVRLEPHGLGIVTVDYATADGTGSKAARAGSDYTETSGTLTFNSLETERTVSVPITDDAHEDDGETFTLTLSNPDGAKLRSGDGEATGTIRNSEIQPLTATFEDVPSAHDGSAFTFRMAFSEDIGISYRALREDALAVTGGRVTRGARVDDRRDLFEMTVEPDGGRRGDDHAAGGARVRGLRGDLHQGGEPQAAHQHAGGDGGRPGGGDRRGGADGGVRGHAVGAPRRGRVPLPGGVQRGHRDQLPEPARGRVHGERRAGHGRQARGRPARSVRDDGAAYICRGRDDHASCGACVRGVRGDLHQGRAPAQADQHHLCDGGGTGIGVGGGRAGQGRLRRDHRLRGDLEPGGGGAGGGGLCDRRRQRDGGLGLHGAEGRADLRSGRDSEDGLGGGSGRRP